MLYILDTDHISLLQRDNPQVRANLASIDEEKRAITVITVVEQIQGWLAFIRRAKKESDAARGFERLRQAMAFYLTIQVLPYDAPAVAEFERLRGNKIRIGTQDLVALQRRVEGFLGKSEAK